MYASGNICNATGKLPQKQLVITGKNQQEIRFFPPPGANVSPPYRQYLLHFVG
jgi:hypothetical protein